MLLPLTRTMSSQVKRTLLFFLKITGVVLLGFVSLGLIIGFFYGSEIKKMMLAQLNQHLATEIKVKEFNFSVLRHFPYASFDMEEVMTKEVCDREEKDTLLYAKNISFLFNIMGVFDKNISIKKVLVKDGMANIHIDANGKNNYHFWKTSEDTTAESSTVDVHLISLKNVRIRYFNEHDNQDYLFTSNTSVLSGKFSAGQFTLNTNADLFVDHFFVNKINYVNGKKVLIHSGLAVDNANGLYRFGKSTVQVADFLFDVEGNVSSTKTSTGLDLSIASHEADLASFISMLPPSYVHYLESFKSTGKFIFKSTIKGPVSHTKNPEVAIAFSVRDGSVTPKDQDISLQSLNLTGTYLNHAANGKDELVIPSISASLGGHAVKGDLRLTDLANPFLSLRAAADLDLSQLQHFIKKDTLESLSGSMNLKIAFAGKVKDLPSLNSGQLYKVQASGTIDLKNVAFQLKRNPLEFKNINGNFTLQDNDIAVNLLTGNISSSDLRLSGRFNNFVNFILIPNQPALFDAKLNSSLLDLDELMSNKVATTQGDTSYILKFNPRLVSNLDVTVGNIRFRQFRASRMQGQIHLDHQVITGRGLTFAAMDGMVYMDATINASRKDSVFMNFDSKIARLDVTKLFTQMENFGQTTMTDKNVKGRVSADVQFNSAWSIDLNIDSRKVRSTCDITIENGELINFTPILALSRYLKVPDLNHIRFSTLKNQIYIANELISIPSMAINSSAMNITASGTHNFDNIVDYRLKLLLTDVLGKKVQTNSEFGEIEDDGLGRTQLLLSMKGPVDNPKFSYDHNGVKEKIKTDIVREKQNLKGILKEEFGMFKKDTNRIETRKKKEELQIDWSSSE